MSSTEGSTGEQDQYYPDSQTVRHLFIIEHNGETYTIAPSIGEVVAGYARPACMARAITSRICGRLYSCDTILERLAQDLEDLAVELGEFIQEEHAMVG